MTAFTAEHQLCSDYCFEASSKTEITHAIYNVSSSYITIWKTLKISTKKKQSENCGNFFTNVVRQKRVGNSGRTFLHQQLCQL